MAIIPFRCTGDFLLHLSTLNTHPVGSPLPFLDLFSSLKPIIQTFASRKVLKQWIVQSFSAVHVAGAASGFAAELWNQSYKMVLEEVI